MLKINLTSIVVDDQPKAVKFYTEILGFEKKLDIPVGEFSWITLTSPAGPQGVELALEPNEFPPAKVFQQALFEAGIPFTAFGVDDVQAEFARLKALGVNFQTEPTEAGPTVIAVFDDTCGNLIQIFQG